MAGLHVCGLEAMIWVRPFTDANVHHLMSAGVQQNTIQDTHAASTALTTMQLMHLQSMVDKHYCYSSEVWTIMSLMKSQTSAAGALINRSDSE